MQSRQVRQHGAEHFEVVEDDGTVVEVTLRRDAREGLGLREVAPSLIVAQAIAMLDEDGRWPPVHLVGSSTDPVDAISLVASVPGALDDLRARLAP